MGLSLVRGRYVIAGVSSSTAARVIEDGAVLVENDRIVDVGTYAALSRNDRIAERLGSGDDIVMPGLVNAHHHLGVTPTQLGVVDQPLEPWLVARSGTRDVDPYLDTMCSAFELIASGVTTVVHLQGRFGGPLADRPSIAGRVIEAYLRVGMRAAYAPLLRDRGLLVYGDDEDLLGSLPVDLAGEVRAQLALRALSGDEQLAFNVGLWERWHAHPSGRIRIHFAPANIHSCSDELLARVYDAARARGTRVQMHLLETIRQREYARRKWGTSAVEHLRDVGALGDELTIAHGVWLSEADVALLAERGTTVAHNPSSNLRLGSGIAPLRGMLRAGVPVALGIDEAGINDDRDLLAEMRLAYTLHRVTGPWPEAPTALDVIRMATEVGARSAGFGDVTGTLAPGLQADLVLVDRARLAGAGLADGVPVNEAIVRRAGPASVRLVMVAGEVIYREGTFTRVSRDDVLGELAADLRRPLRAEETRRATTAARLAPYVERFYDGWPQLDRQA